MAGGAVASRLRCPWRTTTVFWKGGVNARTLEQSSSDSVFRRQCRWRRRQKEEQAGRDPAAAEREREKILRHRAFCGRYGSIEYELPIRSSQSENPNLHSAKYHSRWYPQEALDDRCGCVNNTSWPMFPQGKLCKISRPMVQAESTG
ncbi:hypothetical protein AXF42_Ash007985 [Apostasia shenzhenica]|uniref:Uncharacterized protein n=1 Tax=Apostasia shenzhenica TaxID=1088818 RepID=A0A2I0A895_9ASPA|nr:hypothetical protein AXF42_Ash007985 [Apostasia shenzhenica]